MLRLEASIRNPAPMGMNRSYKDFERRDREAREAEELRLQPERELWEHEAQFHITLFNHRVRTSWPVTSWPTVRAAIAVNRTHLGVVCPACNQHGVIDIKTIGCDPDTTINHIVRKFRCSRCKPNPPAARITGLR